MSTAEAGSAKPGLGWWPKLVLWTLVLVFGVLYLSSVKRNSALDGPVPAIEETVGAAAEVASPAVPPALPSENQVPVAAAGSGGGAEGAGAEPPAAPSKAPEPVSAAESAAFADSLLNKAPTDQRPDEAPAEVAKPASQPPLEAVNEGPSPLPEASGAGAAAVAEPPTPTQSGDMAPQPPAEQGAPASTGQVAERARIIMEYEAMRRAAEEYMRRGWGQPGMPAPTGAPYARPGYGYGPGVYPAR
jgi:hypothetical protein